MPGSNLRATELAGGTPIQALHDEFEADEFKWAYKTDDEAMLLTPFLPLLLSSRLHIQQQLLRDAFPLGCRHHRGEVSFLRCLYTFGV
jgi:hypothetical protein